MVDLGTPTRRQDDSRKFVRKQDLVALKSNDPEALERLEQKLCRYTKFFSSGLSSQDLEDVTSEATVAFYEVLESIDRPQDIPDLEVERLNDVLRKTIERHRKRAQRLLPRSQPEPTHESSGAREIDQLVAKDRLKALVVNLIPLMEKSLELQTEKDHDLIVRSYELDKIGFLAHAAEIEFQTEAAQRKAIQRARTRFNQTLESQLLGAELMKDVLADALRIVQGGDIQRMFEVPEEIIDED